MTFSKLFLVSLRKETVHNHQQQKKSSHEYLYNTFSVTKYSQTNCDCDMVYIYEGLHMIMMVMMMSWLQQ